MSVANFFRRLFGLPIPEVPGCVACGAAEIETLGPDAYRCQSCGHEGGDGLAAIMAERNRTRLRALTPGRLHAKAVAQFEDLRLGILGLAGQTGENAQGDDGGGLLAEISFEIHGLSMPDSVILQDLAEERQQQRLRFDALVQDMRATAALLEALAEHGAPVAASRDVLSRLAVLETPRPNDMMTYCRDALAAIKTWTPPA